LLSVRSDDAHFIPDVMMFTDQEMSIIMVNKRAGRNTILPALI